MRVCAIRRDRNAKDRSTHRHASPIARAMQKSFVARRFEHRRDESRDMDRGKNFVVHRSCPDRATTTVRRRPSIAIASSNRCTAVRASIARARVRAPESHQRIIAARKSIVGSPTPARPPNPRLAGERVGLRRFHPPSTTLCIRHARFCEDAMHRCNTLTGASDVDRDR